MEGGSVQASTVSGLTVNSVSSSDSDPTSSSTASDSSTSSLGSFSSAVSAGSGPSALSTGDRFSGNHALTSGSVLLGANSVPASESNGSVPSSISAGGLSAHHVLSSDSLMIPPNNSASSESGVSGPSVLYGGEPSGSDVLSGCSDLLGANSVSSPGSAGSGPFALSAGGFPGNNVFAVDSGTLKDGEKKRKFSGIVDVARKLVKKGGIYSVIYKEKLASLRKDAKEGENEDEEE